MDNQDWQEIVDALVDAKRCLASAWQTLDGTDGAPGVAPALNTALASIDALYADGDVNAHNADVASWVEVQEFWEKHSERPGFAAGTWSDQAPQGFARRRRLLADDQAACRTRVPGGSRRCRPVRDAADDRRSPFWRLCRSFCCGSALRLLIGLPW